MSISPRLLATTLFSASLVLPPHAAAQVRASEQASVSQTIDGTKLTITYSRPRVRGRNPLFGSKAVSWGEVWTPGANWATMLESNKDITLQGHAVPAGKYTMWFVVHQTGDWTLMLDTAFHRFHMNKPDSNTVKLKFPVHVQDGPFAEVLTWSFPDVRMDGGTLAFAWANKAVPLDIKVQPSLTAIISAAEAQPYIGRYKFVSTKHPELSREFRVMFAHDTLKAEWDTAFVKDGLQGPLVKYMGRFALLRVAPDWFVPGLIDEHGVIYEVLRPELMFEFSRANGRVQSFLIRNANDSVGATATRKE